MMVRHVINIDKEKCIGCGMCEKDCIAHNIVVENHKAGVLSNDCIMCGGLHERSRRYHRI